MSPNSETPSVKRQKLVRRFDEQVLPARVKIAITDVCEPGVLQRLQNGETVRISGQQGEEGTVSARLLLRDRIIALNPRDRSLALLETVPTTLDGTVAVMTAAPGSMTPLEILPPQVAN